MNDLIKDFNLPKLKRDAQLSELPAAGRWVSSDKINLQSLAQDLPVDDKNGFTDADEPVRAIPDPWAQASVFGQAVLDAKHSMHTQSLSQWRGLLAILALQFHHKGDFTLRAQAVQLADNSPFANVLTALTPAVAIDGQAALWSRTSVILMHDAASPRADDEHPIAMTNPICLVSPGRATARTIVPKIDWAQGDLQCPLRAGAPIRSLAELSILYHWLSALHTHVRGFSGDIARRIAQLVDDFAADVQTEMQIAAYPVKPMENAGGALPALFQPLFNAVHLDEDRHVARTEARLMALPPAHMAGEGGAAITGFILADLAVARALGRDESRVMVWKRHSLADVMRSPAKFEDVRKEALMEGYMMLTIDDILTDRAVRFTGNPLIEAHPAGLQEMALPLHPLALLLAKGGANTPPSEVLKSRVRGQLSGDRASFTFTVHLLNDAGEGVKVDLKRDYAANRQTGEGQLVMGDDWAIINCHIWPDFRSSAWHNYMARFYYNESEKSNMVLPYQAVSAAILHDIITRARTASDADATLRACNQGAVFGDRDYGIGETLLKSRSGTVGTTNPLREVVQFSTDPFDAICYQRDFGDGERAKPVGLILIGLNHIAAPKQATKIAVDFGTTNTVGAYGNGAANPITFKNRLVFPLKNAKESVHKDAIHFFRHHFVGFTPPEERQTPIPSVAKPKTPIASDETLWLFRHLIYFHSTKKATDNKELNELNEFRDNTRDAIFNLKWSSDVDIRKAAKDFLTQFIVMTAAELLEVDYNPGASDWMFSIPESLSDGQRTQFEDNIRESMRAIWTKSGGADAPTVATGTIAPLQSEGLAAAKYMLEHGGFTSDKLSVILDIGGGTTDMTIWDKKTPKWKGSIRLAGGHFFTELLVNNTHILDRVLGLKKWAISLSASSSTQSDADNPEDKRRQLAEMLFSGRSAATNDGLDLHRSMEHHWSSVTSAEGAPLRHAAITYLAGIAWYNGLVVRQLLPELSGDVTHDPAYAICGRGGGIFQMLHGARHPDARTDVTRALSTFGKALAMPDTERPRFSASPAPKLEVVRGMLTGKGDIITDVSATENLGTILPLGLSLNTGKGPLAADSLLTLDTYNADLQSVDLTEFKAFLTALEECAGVSIDIDMDRRENAARTIADNTIAQMLSLAKDIAATPKTQQDRIVTEPPFLIALRELVIIMAAPLDHRNTKLIVHGEI